jgi:uncharacterized repeat protein (TIGR04076 family)
VVPLRVSVQVGVGEGLLEFEVVEIRGYCPLYNVGDKMVIDYPRVVLDKGDPLCANVLSSLMRYVQDLEKGADLDELGLSKSEDGNDAFIECEEASKLYANCGTVTFRCCRIVEARPQTGKLSVVAGSRIG